MISLANEWRGTTVATINGMFLPRTIRMTVLLANAMTTEFRRAMSRVHQAFTARGQAMPSLSWRNVVALTPMLGIVWGAVLDGVAERSHEQWASDDFWDRFVPSARAANLNLTAADLCVLALVISAVGLALLRLF
jgi:hypothetical protein